MSAKPDWAALRERFPTLLERAYFTTHCFGPLLRETLADLDEYRRTLALRNRVIDTWYDEVLATRARFAEVFGAGPNDLAIGPNATACQGMLAAALAPDGARKKIITAALDFPSSRYVWHAQARRGYEVVQIQSPDGVAMPTDALVDAIDARTQIVAVPLVAYTNGAMLDAQRIIAAAHAAGAIVVLDAYQAAGIVPIDVRALGVDALVAGTHKWLCGASTGLAFLYVEPGLAERLQPAFPGWFGHAETLDFEQAYVPAPGARRFEQGSPSMEACYAARAGAKFAVEVGVGAMRARSFELSDRLIAGADALGIPLATPRPHAQRAGVVCLNVPDPDGTAAALRERGIDVDTRPGTGIRFSCHPCNTEAEVDRALSELRALTSPRAPRAASGA